MSVRSTAPGATSELPLMAASLLWLRLPGADECESQKDMSFVVDDFVLGEQDGEAQAAAVIDARPAMLPLLPWTRREACRKARRPAAILISVMV